MPKLTREFKQRFQIADEDEERVVSIILECELTPSLFFVHPGSRYEFSDDFGIGLGPVRPSKPILKSAVGYLPRRPQ